MKGYCCDCFKFEYEYYEDWDYIRICKCYEITKKLKNNPFNEYEEWDCPYFEKM